jgi:hypothetical protein
MANLILTRSNKGATSESRFQDDFPRGIQGSTWWKLDADLFTVSRAFWPSPR